MMLKKYAVAIGMLSLALPMAAAAQSNAVFVNHTRVTDALANGAVLLTGPSVKVAGEHRDTAGPLTTERDTTILYVTDGAATLIAGASVQPIARGDLVVIAAKTPRSLKDVSPSISYYLVTVHIATVPAAAQGQTSMLTFV